MRFVAVWGGGGGGGGPPPPGPPEAINITKQITPEVSRGLSYHSNSSGCIRL